MPLNFPTSPTNGQIYENYRWNATVGAWQSISSGAIVTISETAPENPFSGQLWFNSTDGKMYLSYSDGDSVQWVAAVGGFASAINTDSGGISRIFVGSVDPDVDYILNIGDIWIEAV